MYYSSANCRFEVSTEVSNWRILNKVYALRVNSSIGVMPYYSWSSRNNVKYIDGNNIVEGALILNAAQPGQLIRSIFDINNNVDAQKVLDETKRELDIAQQMFYDKTLNVSTVEQIEKNGVIATLTNTLDKNKVLELARRRYEAIRAQDALNDVDNKLHVQSSSHLDEECEIKVMANRREVDRITGIKFTGKSFEITAGSSMNIKYAYPFVARSCTV